MTDRPRMSHWKRWLAIGIAGLALALVAGPYLYIHFVEGKAPAPLTLASPARTTGSGQASSTSQDASSADGTWKVSSGSVVGYRVKEVLFGQSNVAVGRTSTINGSITVDGTTIQSGSFTIDMTTVQSDQSRRDAQFNGRIMETGTYPTATFKLTAPIELDSIPSEGTERTVQATGDLTLHGVTKSVVINLTGRYLGSTFQVAGSIPITLSDWNISNPSFGPVTTEDNGILELALNFSRA
jgi:polyisoprenoid-binding protein YceI